MVTVFWDRKGVLTVEFMQKETIITSEVYCETLKELRRDIQNKRRGMLTYGVRVVLLHDNECTHTIELLALKNCCSISTGSCLTTLFTAPISLRVTTTSLLVIYLKNLLKSQHFNNNEKLMESVKT
jgi:hypothetical protein